MENVRDRAKVEIVNRLDDAKRLKKINLQATIQRRVHFREFELGVGNNGRIYGNSEQTNL